MKNFIFLCSVFLFFASPFTLLLNQIYGKQAKWLKFKQKLEFNSIVSYINFISIFFEISFYSQFSGPLFITKVLGSDYSKFTSNLGISSLNSKKF